MDTRTELLKAAAAVFSQHGFRGSTTRRIADAAGVNEVTLFRYFKSKEALLHEAITSFSEGPVVTPLPATPLDPEREIAEWGESLIARLRSRSSIIRKCMSEVEERPEMISTAVRTPLRAASDLAAYLRKLKALDATDPGFDVLAASAMLMGAIFHDAMGREMMPQSFPAVTKAPRLYSRLLLNAIGYRADRLAPSDSEGRKQKQPLSP
jgi:AcrR family transcriptional regulator